MGVGNLNNNIDIERARYERENRMNQPDFAPGQDLKPISTDGMFGGNSFFDSTPQEVNANPFGDPFGQPSMGGDPFGSNSFGGGMSDPFGQPSMGGLGGGFNTGGTFGPSLNGMPQGLQTQQQTGLTYEKAEQMAKTTVTGVKALGTSLTKVTPLFWYNYCGTVAIVGAVFAGLGLLMGILKLSASFTFIVAGALMGLGGLGASLICKDKTLQFKTEYKEVDEPNVMPTTPEPAFANDFNFNSEPNDFDFPDSSEDNYFPEDESESDEDDIDIDLTSIDVPEEEPKMSTEEALNSIQEVPQGMYTRKYLYDAFVKMLPAICPKFSVLKEISAEDDAFYEMEAAVQEAAEVTGCKETIELQKLQENYATIIATTSRPQGIKPEATADELASIYAHRSNDISEAGRSRVYAKVETVGKTCIFTIFTGKTEMISLKDMYKQCEDYILDSKNYLPVVFGIDPMAKVIVYDLKKLESIIVAGMPRSGKSWFVQNMITQMAALTSPSELQFYICDPKGDISDFKSFCLPHVKKFATTLDGILETLRYLVNVEAPRRKKMIGAGDALTSSQNIWDYKDRYPDVDLPIIYVVIDEVVTLATKFEKEENVEFRGMLRELISQLPALGIRAIMIPHVLKNDIIEKKTSDLVLCRISVMGDPEHVESVTGAKPKDFPFKLTRPGDMGVRMPPVSQNIMYLRAPVLNATNPENRELFDYMRRVWSKLEPDSVKGSVAQQAENDSMLKECMATEQDIDDLDMFGTEEDQLSPLTENFLKEMKR